MFAVGEIDSRVCVRWGSDSNSSSRMRHGIHCLHGSNNRTNGVDL